MGMRPNAQRNDAMLFHLEPVDISRATRIALKSPNQIGATPIEQAVARVFRRKGYRNTTVQLLDESVIVQDSHTGNLVYDAGLSLHGRVMLEQWSGYVDWLQRERNIDSQMFGTYPTRV